jgi:hypothetical protein
MWRLMVPSRQTSPPRSTRWPPIHTEPHLGDGAIVVGRQSPSDFLRPHPWCKAPLDQDGSTWQMCSSDKGLGLRGGKDIDFRFGIKMLDLSTWAEISYRLVLGFGLQWIVGFFKDFNHSAFLYENPSHCMIDVPKILWNQILHPLFVHVRMSRWAHILFHFSFQKSTCNLSAHPPLNSLKFMFIILSAPSKSICCKFHVFINPIGIYILYVFPISTLLNFFEPRTIVFSSIWV